MLGTVPRQLRIGLVNNMPDTALRTTEQQFSRLLNRAAFEQASPVVVSLNLFQVPALPRSPEARADLALRYNGIDTIALAGLDGLIVTGGAPAHADLKHEPHWDSLAGLIDWALASGMPTAWSCMAAHAAVLHCDGVLRRPLPCKLSGVFDVQKCISDPLLAPVQARLLTPHSRHNSLDEQELVRSGYTILTRGDDVGADVFVRRGAGLALFTQGHPEYGPEVLGLEYRRDVRRFFSGVLGTHPALPANYFDLATKAELNRLAEAAIDKKDPRSLAYCEAVLAANQPRNDWRGFATQLYAGWLAEVARYAGAQSPEGLLLAG